MSKQAEDAACAGFDASRDPETMTADEVRGLARDRSLLEQVLAEAQKTIGEELAELTRERDDLSGELTRQHRELRRLATNGTTSSETTSRIADLHERLGSLEQRRIELDRRIEELDRETVSREEAEAAFVDFDTLWARLIPREQARLLKLLIERIEYDGLAGTISLTFRPTSIRALIDRQVEEAA